MSVLSIVQIVPSLNRQRLKAEQCVHSTQLVTMTLTVLQYSTLHTVVQINDIMYVMESRTHLLLFIISLLRVPGDVHGVKVPLVGVSERSGGVPRGTPLERRFLAVGGATGSHTPQTSPILHQYRAGRLDKTECMVSANRTTWYTVEPPSKGHFGSNNFVPNLYNGPSHT